MKKYIWYALALGTFLILNACRPSYAVAQRQTRVSTVVYVRKAPPTPKPEKIRKCRRNQIWIRGHWKWNGHVYVWIKGRCVRKRHGLTWVPGHWKHTRHGWQWVPGHWR